MFFASVRFFFEKLVTKFPKEFLFLIFLLILEISILTGSIISVIPFADYLIDPSLKDPNKITIGISKIFEIFNIEVGYLSFVIFFVATNFFRAFFSLFIMYQILKIRFSIEKSLAKELLYKIFSAKWTFFNNFRQGKILNTLNRELENVGAAAKCFSEVFANLFQILTFLIIPFILNAKMTLSIISLVVLLGMPFLLLNKLGHKFGKKRTDAANKYIGRLNETFQAAKLLIGSGKAQTSIKDNLVILHKYINENLKSQIVNLVPIYLFKPLAIVALIMVLGSYVDTNKLPEYAAIFWSLYGALPLVANIFGKIIVMNNFRPSYEQLEDIQKRTQEHHERSDGEEFKNNNNNIIFENVTFNYPGENILIDNCSFTILKNKITSLTGESGSGKSTLVDLLMGLQNPSNGRILVNEKDLKGYNLKSFRKKIGYVPQDPFLFYTTIRNNLLWVKKDLSDEEIVNALKLSNSYDFVMNLPNKLDTLVGERGLEISGGERQRISLARALIIKPDILILDEATSSIDNVSEELINKSLRKISEIATILIVAHRETAIKNADKIISIKNGKIYEK